MPKVQIIRDEKLREKVKEALEKKKLIVIAQRDTTRVVRPADPDKVIFIAREEL